LARSRELATFNKIAKTINSTLDFEKILKVIMTEIAHLVQAEAWSLFLVDWPAQQLVLKMAHGEKERELRDLRMGLQYGFAGWVARVGKPCLIPDARLDPRFFKGVDKKTGFKTRSVLAVPIFFRKRVLGVLEVINKVGGEPFTARDLAVVAALAEQASVAIENARLYQEVERLSVTDDLTQLHNSRYCNRFLEESLREAAPGKRPLSLIFLDLDSLKEIDDSHGHLMGGEALREVAQRIREMLPPGAVASRYGGDEFVIVLPGFDSARAFRLAESIRRAVASRPFLLSHGLGHTLTASLGIATFPKHARTKEALMRKADQAMYQVKETGKNRTAIAEQ
jgi:diguanylate cyclase (GGDEF)-like protein